MRRVLLYLLAVVLLLSLVAQYQVPTIARQAATSPPSKGMNASPAVQWWRDPTDPQPDSWYGAADIPAQIALLQQLGVTSYRFEIPWSLVSTSRPGGSVYSSTAAQDPNCTCYDWARTDTIVASLVAAGISPLPQLVYTPVWATGASSTYQQNPPASAQYYPDFVTAVVTRYHTQIHEWELWNEPDYSPHGWSGSASQYVQLILKPGYQAVKALDPAATVVVGGLASAAPSWVYNAGGAGFFDVMSIHFYPSDSNGCTSYTGEVQGVVNNARSQMASAGDGSKPLWFTEVGIPTADSIPASQAFTSAGCQAAFIANMYQTLTGTARVYWYTMADANVYGGPPPTTLLKQTFWGIVTRDLQTRKPGFCAYAAAPSGGLSCPSGTPTSTPLPATSTATAVPATATPVPATSTPLPPTATPSSTAPSQPSATPGAPSATATPVDTATPAATLTATPVAPTATPGTGCQFRAALPGTHAAFCDTFDAPAGTGNRSGDLNGIVWGVSRTTQHTDVGQGQYDAWNNTTLAQCSMGAPVFPPQDVAICNGQLVEGTTDADAYTVLAAYPKQPWDIAGRTGTAVFDVANNTQGIHAAWPAFWYTDQPIPAPQVPAPPDQPRGQAAYPRNGIGFSLADLCGAGSWCGSNCAWPAPAGFTVDSITVVHNYQPVQVGFTKTGCIQEPTAPGQLNHIEVQISATTLTVWGTDAGSTVLRQIAEADNLTVPLTRGLIWVEDVHYNGNKFGSQGTDTFAWDNVGFDGPVLPQDRTFDVPDHGQVVNAATENLGWFAPSGAGQAVTTLPVDGTALAAASTALVTFDDFPVDTGSVTVALNGNAPHTIPWPFPDTTTFAWRTYALAVPVSEVVAGANSLTFSSSGGQTAFANIDIVLPGVGNAGTPQPTVTAAPSSTFPPTNTPVPPTNTPIPATDTTVPGTATGTATPLAPTSTATPAPPTSTATPPPATSTRTNTPVPTATPVGTATSLTFTVNSITASPAVVARGGLETLTVVITCSRTLPANNKVLFSVHNNPQQWLYHPYKLNVAFTAGVPTTLTMQMPVGTTPEWTYNPLTFNVAISVAGGADQYKGSTATFTVT